MQLFFFPCYPFCLDRNVALHSSVSLISYMVFVAWVGALGNNMYAATFLWVKGTMSGNKPSCHKCPVLKILCSTTLFSSRTAPDVKYSAAPAGRRLFVKPFLDKNGRTTCADLCNRRCSIVFWCIVWSTVCLLLCSFSLCFSYSHLESLTKKWGIAAHSLHGLQWRVGSGFSKGMFCNRSALLRVCQSGASGMLQAGKLCLWCVNSPPGCAMRL